MIWAQAQKKLVRDRLETVNAMSSLPAVTPHQAAVLGKRMVLVKRYSATEAMQIHAAAAAAESERAEIQSQVPCLPYSKPKPDLTLHACPLPGFLDSLLA